MTLSRKGQPYIIPEYSLTGDLLGYRQCGLLYRYTRRGLLPPSRPVQLWFGEFLHGTMAEAYLRWKEDPDEFRFPWDWAGMIHPIEIDVYRRLLARGLSPTPKLFCPYDGAGSIGRCGDPDHPHKLLASRRVEAAINTWGPHLFPLIDGTEVPLRGCRDMPERIPGARSSYFGVTGVVDVLSSVNLERADSGNLILRYLNEDETVRSMIAGLGGSEYEIIIDYKGMTRPDGERDDDIWMAHEWQVLTYAWLRSRQQQARPPVAGILFYLNELPPPTDGDDDGWVSATGARDPPGERELVGGTASSEVRERRSIRVVPTPPANQSRGLDSFDRVVAEIETNIIRERQSGAVTECWPTRFDENTCTSCDYRAVCPDRSVHGLARIMPVP